MTIYSLGGDNPKDSQNISTGSGYMGIHPFEEGAEWKRVVRPFVVFSGIAESEYGVEEFNVLSVWRDAGFRESSAGLTICGISIGVKINRVRKTP